MLKNLSIRVRVLMLAGVLMLLTIGIAGAGWYALAQVATAIAESEREGQEAQLFLIAERDFSGAFRRLFGYMQTATDDDLQRYAKRKADADAGLVKAIDLASDPARRQATVETRQAVNEFLAVADAIVQERKALGQRADGIRDALGALAGSGKREQDSSVANNRVAYASTADVRSAGLAQTVGRTLPVPMPKPQILRDRAARVGEPVIAEAETGVPADQSKPGPEIAAGAARSLELVQRVGEAMLLVILNPSEATFANYTTAMQSMAGLTPPNEAAARLLALVRDAATSARTVLESDQKLQSSEHGLFVRVQELRTRLVGHNQEVVKAALMTASSGIIQLITISGLTLVLGVTLAWLIARGIIVPLKAMTGAVARLADGGGSVEIPEVRSRSELGAMARAVGVFIQNFKELADNARQAAISVGETSVAAGQVSDGAREQNTQLSQVATALRESTSALRSVSENTRAASIKATHAAAFVQKGLSSVERLAAVVETIAKNGRKVNEIAEVIGQIANRTHILSLNAAIEAARAGEHGKGFVVVAQEVGKLAESAGQNAKLISVIVHQATTDASEGDAAADAARGAIHGIAEETNETTRMIHSSSSAIEQQQATITQIDESVTQLRAIATSNSVTAEEIAATMTQLSQITEETRVKLARFTGS